MTQTLKAVTIEPDTQAQACIIWLHGLGASGHDFVPIVPELRLAKNHGIRFIFPHAPSRPVTLNLNMKMPAWYDIYAIELHTQEDHTGIMEATNLIHQLIDQQREQGIEAENIIVIGFSQGAGLALYSGLHYKHPLAGIGVLSGYLPLAKTLPAASETPNGQTPILMMHGTEDKTLPLVFGEASLQRLQQQGYAVDWKIYPMEHTVSLPQVYELSHWLNTRLKTLIEV